MAKKEKTAYEYKLGEEVTDIKKMGMGFLMGKTRCLKITYGFQDEKGTQMEMTLKHTDWEEEEDD